MNSVNAVTVKKFFEITLSVHFMKERNHSNMLNSGAYPYITQCFARTKNIAAQGLTIVSASASAFGLWPIISLARCSASAYCEKCCFGHSLQVRSVVGSIVGFPDWRHSRLASLFQAGGIAWELGGILRPVQS